MVENKSKFTIEDYQSDFIFEKKENGLNIKFNRVAFIFFIFFIIYFFGLILFIFNIGLSDETKSTKNLS